MKEETCDDGDDADFGEEEFEEEEPECDEVVEPEEGKYAYHISGCTYICMWVPKKKTYVCICSCTLYLHLKNVHINILHMYIYRL